MSKIIIFDIYSTTHKRVFHFYFHSERCAEICKNVCNHDATEYAVYYKVSNRQLLNIIISSIQQYNANYVLLKTNTLLHFEPITNFLRVKNHTTEYFMLDFDEYMKIFQVGQVQIEEFDISDPDSGYEN